MERRLNAAVKLITGLGEILYSFNLLMFKIKLLEK